MATYQQLKYNFSGTQLTGVVETANNLSDVANAGTSRTNLQQQGQTLTEQEQ